MFLCPKHDTGQGLGAPTLNNLTKYQVIKGLRKGDKIPYEKMVYDMSLGLGFAPPKEIRRSLEEALRLGLITRVGEDQVQLQVDPPKPLEKPPKRKRVEKGEAKTIARRVEVHIMGLTDKKRFERGSSIPGEEITSFTIEENKVRATIRGYPASLDLVNKRIEHKGCIDWQRQKKSGKLCKHLVKLLIELAKHGRGDWVLRVDKTWDYT